MYNIQNKKIYYITKKIYYITKKDKLLYKIMYTYKKLR